MILYGIGAICTWVGFAFALRALFLAIGSLLDRGGGISRAGMAAAVAVVLLIAGPRLAPSNGLQIPLMWVVMPFSGWLALVSVIVAVVRLTQGLSGLNPRERMSRFYASGAWLLVGLAGVGLYRLDPDAQILPFKGGIPLSAGAALTLLLFGIAAVSAMAYTSRALRARGWAKTLVTHLALIAGSMLFGLPFAWLLITSFKEDIDMASPTGIVWVPRVQETVPYFSPTNPRYEVAYQGEKVEGTITSETPDGAVKLDVLKPMSMRGVTVDTVKNRLKQVPTQAKLVTARIEGVPVKGLIAEDLDDGRKVVQVLEPQALKGRRATFLPSEVEPLRHVGLRWQNYSDALDFLPPESKKGLVYFKNTLIVVILSVIGTLLSSALVAYAFSRMRFPGRDALFTVMLATMMLPGAVTKLPQFMIFRSLGWIDTLYPLWVPAFFGSALNIFLLRQFFRQIPMELEDAAKIDGAGYLKTFWAVMLPQVKPALAVIMIWTVVGAWNDFMNPLIYLSSPEHMTISYAVQLYASDRSGEPGLVTAFTTMSMMPVLLLFFFTQKYFMEGGASLTGLGGK